MRCIKIFTAGNKKFVIEKRRFFMEGKKSKKKVLLYYLILAACLLVIAAVTVTLVFTVGKRNNLTDGPQIEKPNTDDNKDPNDGKTPDDGKNDDDKKPDNKPTNSDDSWGLPLESASITCGYEFTFDKTLIRYAVHQGMDFEANAGDNVLAARAGTVTAVVTDNILNENYVTITHSDGVTSTYKYIVAKEGLQVGDTVKRGDIIGTVAEAGGMEMNDGAHLHFEIRVNGRTVDPDTYLDVVKK